VGNDAFGDARAFERSGLDPYYPNVTLVRPFCGPMVSWEHDRATGARSRCARTSQRCGSGREQDAEGPSTVSCQSSVQLWPLPAGCKPCKPAHSRNAAVYVKQIEWTHQYCFSISYKEAGFIDMTTMLMEVQGGS
jgi:hypothetical protein